MNSRNRLLPCKCKVVCLDHVQGECWNLENLLTAADCHSALSWCKDWIAGPLEPFIHVCLWSHKSAGERNILCFKLSHPDVCKTAPRRPCGKEMLLTGKAPCFSGRFHVSQLLLLRPAIRVSERMALASLLTGEIGRLLCWLWPPPL